MFGMCLHNFILLIFLIAGATPVIASPAENLRPYTNNPVGAVVEGEPSVLDDLKNAQIHDAMDRLHKMQESVLKQKILRILSKKYPELNRQKIREVRPEDIEGFYNTTPGVKELGTLEQMKDEIRHYLEDAYRATHIEKKYQYVLDKGWAKVYLKPPSEFRLVAGIGSAMRWFRNDDKISRKVFLLEYSDFQCPFCKRVQSTLLKLRERYSNQVQFGYRHFPLAFHKEAQDMAEAVECAREQGRFWELHALFYKANGETKITRNKVIQFAKRVGVKDLPEFQKCWDTGKHREQVLRDIREGIQLGIQGTPAFILGVYDEESDTISGEMLSGAVSEEKFKMVIEKYLAVSSTEAKLTR
jgi:protein-disulfide isomerase